MKKSGSVHEKEKKSGGGGGGGFKISHSVNWKLKTFCLLHCRFALDYYLIRHETKFTGTVHDLLPFIYRVVVHIKTCLILRHDDLKTMLDGNKDNVKLEAMKRIIGVSVQVLIS